MTCRETQHLEHDLTSERKVMSSAEIASGYVNRMIERESRGWGDTSNAMERLQTRYGLPFWTLNHLRTKRAKSIDATLFQRIRAAYLDMCERQIAHLRHELDLEKEVNPDALMEDFESEASELLAKVREAKKTPKRT
jgi:hypothetical protein